MCMHAQEVFISNKIYKKPVTFFKMVFKKLFSSQNVMKKLFETHYSLEKKLSASPKNGPPSPPPPPRYPDKKVMVRALVFWELAKILDFYTLHNT